MVYHICVIKGNNFREYERPIISFEQWCDGDLPDPPKEYLAYFDAMTTNFRDLGYWRDSKNLHGRNAEEVATNIRKALEQLRSEGYKAYDKESVHESLYTWEFGRVNKPNSIMTEEMPREDRIAILFYHLENLLQIAEEYDKDCYFFINKG